MYKRFNKLMKPFLNFFFLGFDSYWVMLAINMHRRRFRATFKILGETKLPNCTKFI